MGIRAQIYIGFLREDKREKNSLKKIREKKIASKIGMGRNRDIRYED